MEMIKVIEIGLRGKRIPIPKFKKDLKTAVQMCFYNANFLSDFEHLINPLTREECVSIVRSLEDSISGFDEDTTSHPDDWIKEELFTVLLESGCTIKDEYTSGVVERTYYRIEEIMGLLN